MLYCILHVGKFLCRSDEKIFEKIWSLFKFAFCHFINLGLKWVNLNFAWFLIRLSIQGEGIKWNWGQKFPQNAVCLLRRNEKVQTKNFPQKVCLLKKYENAWSKWLKSDAMHFIKRNKVSQEREQRTLIYD